MNVKMKRYAKALVAFVLSLAMVSEAWGGLSFVSEAETTGTSAQAETGIPADAVAFPEKTKDEWAATTLPDGNNYTVSNEREFVSFARASRVLSFAGKTVYLASDFTYKGSAFAGIGTTSYAFEGTFDGMGHKIANLLVGSAGIFIYTNNATIKNLVIDNATMTGNTYDMKGVLVTKAYGENSLIDGVTIQNTTTMNVKSARCAILVGYAEDKFPIQNCKIIDSTMNCALSEGLTVAKEGYGLVIGHANKGVELSKVEVTGSTMNFDANSWVSNIGGLVGTMTAGGTITDCSVSGLTINGAYVSRNRDANGYSITTDYSENIGGAVGYMAGTTTVENVIIDNANVTMANAFNHVGGFAGYVTEGESTFTNCSVTNTNVTGTEMIKDPTDGVITDTSYYKGVAGFVGCIDCKGTFDKCFVDLTNVLTRTRYRYAGGLIGSTFTYKTDAEGLSSKGIINVSQCAVTNTKVETKENRNCNVGGGLIALLAEGSTVTDCYVYNFTAAKNTNSLYIGGLIGDIYDIQQGSDKDGKTVVKNCFVGKATLKGYHYVGPVIGDIDAGVDTTGLSNLLHCKLQETASATGEVLNEELHVWIERNVRAGETPSINTYEQVKEVAHESLTNRELAFLLNCGGSDGNPSSDIWMQGAEYPVFSDGSQKPIRKVIFQAEGESFAYYTNAQGKLDAYPQPDDGYKWKGYDLDTIKDVVFEENTWIYQILINEELKVSNYEAYMDTETDFYIDSVEELIAFRELSKEHTFEGKTIHLLKDIDWGGSNNWGLGIGSDTVPFGGTFDGHGHTISNLYGTSHGLFLYLGYKDTVIAQPTIKNFTLDNAQITGTNGSAIVVARIVGNPRNSSLNSQILNVHVTNSTMTSSTSNAAIIAGRNASGGGDAVTISGCTVTDSTVECTATAGSEINNYGFIIARDFSNGYSRIIGCKVTDSEIISENCSIYQVGGVTGYTNGATHIEECTIDGCTIDCARETDVDSKLIGGVIGYTNNVGAHIVDCTVSGTEIKTAGVTTNTGLIVGHFIGGKISGAKVINSAINSTYNGESQSGLIGGIAGKIGLDETADTLPEVVVSDCELEGVTINLASNSYAVGGMIGRTTKYVDVIVKDSVAKNIQINSTYANQEIPAVYSFGGAIGHAQEDITAQNVIVEGVQIASKKSFRAVGGFIGLVQGTNGSTFEKCKVTSYTKDGVTTISSLYDNKGGASDWSGDYSYNVGGLAGLIVTDSSIVSCTVESMDVYARERIRGFGGIVGSVFDARTTNSSNTEDKVNGTATMSINRCTVSDVVFTSGGASGFIGGIAGTISEGSSITNCLISGFKHDKLDADGSGSNNTGMIVGRQYDTYTDTNNTTRTTINNCYVQNSVVRVAETGGIVYGNAVGSRAGENNYYYQCTLENVKGNGQLYKYCIEVIDATILTNKELAYNLNTTNGTEPNSGSWAQGYDANGNGTHPIIADEEHFPVAYVTYLRYNSDTGYAAMEYLKFPISPDGTIDYANGERTYVKKTTLYEDGSTGTVNRQTLSSGVAEQEPIDWTREVYRESMVTEPCTTYTSEPAPNSGRVWQYPEGKITSDVTITQVAKTAWDFNGDTELSVSDLVRLKKSEEKNYNSNVCKASIIGTMLTNKVFAMEVANSSYTENQDLSSAGYLPSYRLRRVILTPPSTEVSVLSYNMYYDTYANIDDETRQDTIMDMLGLKRPADNETLSTRGSFVDNTEPKADIIALQEISADYWHQRLYKEYLAPWQEGTDANSNDKIDPSEVKTKTYYTYKHVGRGRYGHVFYNTEGTAFKGDSYSLILYNKEKYEYDADSGQSGTIYFSNTPTVASHGWGVDEVDNKLDSQRAANWAIFTNRQTGECFMFVSVHLSHDETGVDRQIVRMKQIELLLRRIKEIIGQGDRGIATGGMSGGMPIIIAGDFNASFNSGTDAYSYAMEQGYEDARETAVVSSENHGAFNNWTQTDETKYAYGDHFLVNHRCEVQKYEVVDGDESDITYNRINDTYHMSDHCPIRATIDIGTDYIASTTVEKTGHEYHEVLGLY